MTRHPAFARLSSERLRVATDADLAEWTAAAKVIDDANLADYQARCEKYRQILALAGGVWEGDALKKAERWLKTNGPRSPIQRWGDRISDIRRDAEEHRRKTAAEQARSAESAENIARIALAVAWLKERGKEPGRDYDATHAVSYADEIACHEEIERQRAAATWHDFSGNNCEGPCEGWDGEDRRCQCGNRRVCWTRGYGHSFEKPYVYAEAH